MQMDSSKRYRLVRYMLLGAAEGVVAGWVILLALKHLDVMGIGSLISTSSDGALALVMMLVFFGITFGMVGIAWRIMVLLPEEPERDRDGRH